MSKEVGARGRLDIFLDSGIRVQLLEQLYLYIFDIRKKKDNHYKERRNIIGGGD